MDPRAVVSWGAQGFVAARPRCRAPSKASGPDPNRSCPTPEWGFVRQQRRAAIANVLNDQCRSRRSHCERAARARQEDAREVDDGCRADEFAARPCRRRDRCAAAGRGVAWADPPTRVVRLAYTNGAVSFLPAGDNDWVQASINRPLWTGTNLWTAGRAQCRVADGQCRAAPRARDEPRDRHFDDHTARFRVNPGGVSMFVRSTEGAIEIDTPNLAFSIRS